MKKQRLLNSFWKGLNFGSLSQVFVTAFWEINDPVLREQRRKCMTLYGISLIIFAVGLPFAFRSFGILAIFWVISLIPWLIASGIAEEIEEQVLQQKTPGPKSEGEDVG